MWLDFLQNGRRNKSNKDFVVVDDDVVVCNNRGAYSGSTVPGSKPFKDGLEIAVSLKL